jgi:hypothetical protein
VKDEFKKGIQAIRHTQDHTDAQAQADIHAPVKEGQKEQVKLFGAQETEELGWSFKPGGAGLQSGDEIDAPRKNGIHGSHWRAAEKTHLSRALRDYPAASPSWRRGRKSLLIRRDATPHPSSLQRTFKYASLLRIACLSGR